MHGTAKNMIENLEKPTDECSATYVCTHETNEKNVL